MLLVAYAEIISTTSITGQQIQLYQRYMPTPFVETMTQSQLAFRLWLSNPESSNYSPCPALTVLSTHD